LKDKKIAVCKWREPYKKFKDEPYDNSISIESGAIPNSQETQDFFNNELTCSDADLNTMPTVDKEWFK